MTIAERPFEVVADGLRLDGRLREGKAGGTAWVVLHPHPQYGGDMDNHVVTSICETLATLGCTTLRFNFRGTGRSEGAYSGGAGERVDALAAVLAVRDAGPRVVGLAGYSFGAAIAALVAEEAEVDRLMLVSPPTMAGALRVPDGVATLVVTGDSDPVSDATVVRGLTDPSVRSVVVPGVDHGWWPGIDDLASLVAEFATSNGA